MLISARKASRVLARDGVSPWTALQVLASGLVGDPLRIGTMEFYDEARVDELAARPSVTWGEAEQRCPAGLFISRRGFPATGSRSDQLAALHGQ
jgi:hypothetical protein